MDVLPLTVSQMFVRALSLPVPASLKPQSCPDGAYCTLRPCGRPVSVGYAVTDVTTDATNEFVDTFRGNPSGVVCADCAALFTQDHNLGAWLIFADGTAYNPLISRESAQAWLSPASTEGERPEVKRAPKIDRSGIARPCWSDLVRQIWPERQGENVVVLLTTNTKKRQWPRAVVGPLGTATPIYLHDGPDECVRRVDWAAMLECLDLVERVYGATFSKESLRTNLLMQTKAAEAIGWSKVTAWEKQLRPWRQRPEFAPALLIAQKLGETPGEPTGQTKGT